MSAAATASATAEPAPPPVAQTTACPAATHVWTAKDYEDCAEALRRGPLIRARGPQADVFARMVNRENLASVRDASAPLDDRVRAVGDLSLALGHTLKPYLDALERDPSLGREELALAAYIVHATAIARDLADEFVLQLDPNDARWEARMGGLDRVTRGSADVVIGALQIQSEAPTRALGASFWADAGDDWVALVHTLSPLKRQEAMRAFDELVKTTTDPAIAAALAKTKHDLLSRPSADWRIAKDGSTSPSADVPFHVRSLFEIEVDPAAPYRAVAALVRGAARAGNRRIELRLPNDVARLRLLFPKNEALPATQRDLRLTAILVKEGISLKGRGGNVAPGCTDAGPGLAVPNRADHARDIVALAGCAAKLKQAFPKARSVLGAATPTTPFSDVLAASEALRGASLELFPDLRLETAKSK